MASFLRSIYAGAGNVGGGLANTSTSHATPHEPATEAHEPIQVTVVPDRELIEREHVARRSAAYAALQATAPGTVLAIASAAISGGSTLLFSVPTIALSGAAGVAANQGYTSAATVLGNLAMVPGFVSGAVHAGVNTLILCPYALVGLLEKQGYRRAANLLRAGATISEAVSKGGVPEAAITWIVSERLNALRRYATSGKDHGGIVSSVLNATADVTTTLATGKLVALGAAQIAQPQHQAWPQHDSVEHKPPRRPPEVTQAKHRRLQEEALAPTRTVTRSTSDCLAITAGAAPNAPVTCNAEWVGDSHGCVQVTLQSGVTQPGELTLVIPPPPTLSASQYAALQERLVGFMRAKSCEYNFAFASTSSGQAGSDGWAFRNFYLGDASERDAFTGELRAFVDNTVASLLSTPAPIPAAAPSPTRTHSMTQPYDGSPSPSQSLGDVSDSVSASRTRTEWRPSPSFTSLAQGNQSSTTTGHLPERTLTNTWRQSQSQSVVAQQHASNHTTTATASMQPPHHSNSAPRTISATLSQPLPPPPPHGAATSRTVSATQSWPLPPPPSPPPPSPAPVPPSPPTVSAVPQTFAPPPPPPSTMAPQTFTSPPPPPFSMAPQTSSPVPSVSPPPSSLAPDAPTGKPGGPTGWTGLEIGLAVGFGALALCAICGGIYCCCRKKQPPRPRRVNPIDAAGEGTGTGTGTGTHDVAATQQPYNTELRELEPSALRVNPAPYEGLGSRDHTAIEFS